MSIECQHGYLARACDQCEADAEIARLTRELEEAHAGAAALLGNCGKAHQHTIGACPMCERDEARQALEAERARVAELGRAIREAPHHQSCVSIHPYINPKPCNCWKSRALAADGGEG